MKYTHPLVEIDEIVRRYQQPEETMADTVRRLVRERRVYLITGTIFAAMALLLVLWR